ncbi:hypothetical protein UFOVP1155_46 [uncultured Caudovirales phage]|uniref:Uncharacterized protein n=1 Tax=uncultured Caudovirales phage TaxID=2100421 RepID=A0A6J5R278_9CAUD|nr:hypothetical protein UFOVP1155_46 [uncultured Caudovirales phage]
MKKTYSSSRDEEIYLGDFSTPEEAAVDAFTDDPELGVVWVGENQKRTAHAFVSADRILEDAAERAYDESGECSEDWLTELMRNKEKCADLKKLVGDWIEANDSPKFWTVEHVRKFERADMVSEGLLEGA